MKQKLRYAFITSMDETYYNRCGKDMLVSFYKRWHPDFKLFVYNENFKPAESFCSLMSWNLGDDYENFQLRHSNHRIKTFAKKAFSIIHAMENIECDRLVWLDADSVITNKITEKKLDNLLPEDKLSLHFGVNHVKNDITYFSCETGLFILNKKHAEFKNFCNLYKSIYVNDLTDGLRRFYDGEVYGKTILNFDEKDIVDLNINKKYKTPISKSEFRHYITHRKASLKDKKYAI